MFNIVFSKYKLFGKISLKNTHFKEISIGICAGGNSEKVFSLHSARKSLYCKNGQNTSWSQLFKKQI